VVDMHKHIEKSLQEPTISVHKTSPVESVKRSATSEEHKEKWLHLGYDALSRGKCAVLLMAGGQGTRLGFDKPKGLFDVGLPSHKSLFQLQAERLRRLCQLCTEKTGRETKSIPWVIMTSSLVHKDTVEFFESHNYFGLPKTSVTFFLQDDFPTLTPDGKMLLQSKSSITMSPNGNGGVWRGIARHGILDDWNKNGIEWVATYSVDNILVKMADPMFLGFCIENKLEIGSKVVPKSKPDERVGVLAVKDGRYGVVEYTEIDEHRRNLRNEKGELVYNASHLVINTYSMDFVRTICKDHMIDLPFHLAKKKQKISGELVGKDTTEKVEIDVWKMELFAFDVFEFAHSHKVVAFETVRSEEFSPLKNALDVPTDNAKTCREHLSHLHINWLQKAGATITNPSSEEVCEISPLVSYAGEGLESLVKGKVFTLPLHLH